MPATFILSTARVRRWRPWGSVDDHVFRSACKAFQLIPCITSGAADALGFDEEEIALGAASHSGEPMHVEVAARLLTKAGFAESDLRCGSHLPFSSAATADMQRAGEQPT
ncbi:MAG: asparaginase [Acidobacteria bacterium]|nr:asparaginase [Acidobacteriota bacterium]